MVALVWLPKHFISLYKSKKIYECMNYEAYLLRTNLAIFFCQLHLGQGVVLAKKIRIRDLVYPEINKNFRAIFQLNFSIQNIRDKNHRIFFWKSVGYKFSNILTFGVERLSQNPTAAKPLEASGEAASYIYIALLFKILIYYRKAVSVSKNL